MFTTPTIVNPSVGGDGGAITLHATHGNLRAVSLNTTSLGGIGGAVTLEAVGNITIDDTIITASLNDPSLGANNVQGGEVNLIAGNNITTGDIGTFAQVDLTVAEVIIDDLSASATGGGITLNAGGDISTGFLNSSANVDVFANANVIDTVAINVGIDGDILGEDWETIGNLEVIAQGGNINLSGLGSITTLDIITSAIAEANAFTSPAFIIETVGDTPLGNWSTIGNLEVTAHGGTLNFTAQDAIILDNIDTSGVATADARASMANFIRTTEAVEFGDWSTIGNLEAIAQGGNIELASQDTLTTATLNPSGSADSSGRIFAPLTLQAEIQNDLTIGNWGTLGDLASTAQSGTLELSAQGTMTTTSVDASSDARTDGRTNPFIQGNSEALLGTLRVNNWATLGNLEAISNGGNLTFSSPSNLTTTTLDTSAFAGTFADASFSFPIDGNFTVQEGAQVGNLEAIARGGNLNLSSQSTLTTTTIDSSTIVNTSADAFFTVRDGDNLIEAGGTIGDVNTISEGGNLTGSAQDAIDTNRIDTASFTTVSVDVNEFGSFGDGGTGGNFNILTQGGNLNLSSQGTLTTTNIDASGTVNIDANANSRDTVTAINTTVTRDTVVGNGGSFGNFEVSAAGGTLDFFSQGAMTLGTLDISGTTDLSVDVSSGSTFNISIFFDFDPNVTVDLLEILGDVTVGDGGRIGDIAVTTQGGNLNFASQSTLTIADINSSGTVNGSADASSEVNAPLDGLDSNISGNIDRFQITGEVSVGDGGIVGDITVTGEGGTLNLSSPETITTNNLNTSTNINGSSDVSTSIEADVNNRDPFLNVDVDEFTITGDIIVGDGGTIGDLTVTAVGGILDIASQSTITNNLNTSGTADGSNAEIEPFIGEDVETLGEVQMGNNGELGNQSAFALGGDSTLNVANDILIGNLLAFSNASTNDNTHETGNGGNLTFTSTNNLTLENILINSNALGGGNGGDITFDAPIISFTNTDVTSTIRGVGDAGQITISGADSFTLDTSRLLTALEPGAVGTGGNIEIEAASAILSNFAIINTSTFAQGNAGDVSIEVTDSLSLDNSSIFSFSTALGNSGNIDISTEGNVTFSNLSLISTATTIGATGEGGNLTIDTGSLTLSNGSQLQALTQGAGDSGNIEIDATNAINISGLGGTGFVSGVFTTSEESSDGQGGNITITTPGTLILSDGGVLNAQTSSQQPGGNIEVEANILQLTNGGQILTSTLSDGSAGNITVTVMEEILISGIDSNFANRVIPNPPSEPLDPTPFSLRSTTSIGEEEPNDNSETAQGLNTFFLDAVNDFNQNVEFSTRIPYTSISGQGSEPASSDRYRFQVSAAGTRGTFDIDNGFEELSSGSINTSIRLFNNEGILLAENDDAFNALGAAGSEGENVDPYLRFVFTEPGSYILEVDSSAGNGIGFSGNFPRTYDLQISLDTANVAARTITNTAASGLFAQTDAAGAAGNITINTPQLTIQDGAEVSAFTSDRGAGGSITVFAPEFVTLGGNSELSVQTSGAGRAGNITITTDTLKVTEQAIISATATETAITSEQGGSIALNASNMDLRGTVGVFAETQGEVPAGTLTLQPDNDKLTLNIDLTEGAEISASTSGSGPGGSLILTAPETITLRGRGRLAAESSASGRAGDVKITTQQLFLEDGVEVSARATAEGIAGNITIDVDNLTLTENSLISASNTDGVGGNLNITANGLTVNNGSQLQTTTLGIAQAGEIILQVVDNITLSGQNSGVFATTDEGSTGNGGNIIIDPETVLISDGATIATNSLGSGEGGSIDLTAGSLILDNGSITAETTQANGGEITLNLGNRLTLNNGSVITATAGTEQAGGDGGNVTIEAEFIVAFPDDSSNGNDIIANAFEGTGGQINITATNIFNLTEQLSLEGNGTNDIDASSEFGSQGTIELNTPDVDPASGLTELPSNLDDASQLIDRSCETGSNSARASSFTITGRGGIPLSPTDEIEASTIISNWVLFEQEEETNPSEEVNENSESYVPETVLEAQGWIIGEEGTIILTAQPTTILLQQQGWQTSVSCK